MAGESIGWKSELYVTIGGSLVKLAGVTSITPPDPVLEEVEVTDLDAEDRYRDFIPTMRDSGVCTAVLNYVGGSATDTGLRGLRLSGETGPVEVVYSDENGDPLRKISFNGWVRRYSEPELSLDGVKQNNLEIRVRRKVTEGAAGA